MDKLLIFLFFSAVGACPNQEDAICCFPRKMSGKVGTSVGLVLNGKGVSVGGLLDFAYDLDMKRMGTNGILYVSGVRSGIHSQTVYDYDKMKKYEIVGGPCKVEDIKFAMAECIPSNAKKFIDSYYGIGDKKFNVSGYSYRQPGLPGHEDEHMEISTTVMDADCTALAEHYVINNNAIVSNGFMDLSKEVKQSHRSILEIPDGCPGSVQYPLVP